MHYKWRLIVEIEREEERKTEERWGNEQRKLEKFKKNIFFSQQPGVAYSVKCWCKANEMMLEEGMTVKNDTGDENRTALHFCRDNHQQPHWENLSLCNDASTIHPSSLSLHPHFSSLVFHLSSKTTKVETWIEGDRYTAGRRARTRVRTREGSMEEMKERLGRMWGGFFFFLFF